MLQGLGSLFEWPWIYLLVALSVLLDVFVPVLPSGVLVVSAATAGSTGTSDDILDVLALLACAAVASCLGDLIAYRLAFRGGDWFARRMASSRRLSAAHDRLGQVLASGGGALVVLARFADAVRGQGADASEIDKGVEALKDTGSPAAHRYGAATSPEIQGLAALMPLREFVSSSPAYSLLVERERALYGA